MVQGYERGWRKYSYEEMPMRDVRAHGADIPIRAATALNRGPGELQISLMELPPDGSGDAISLHIHRDLPTARDVEEIYIILDGHGTMTFTSGDKVDLSPGDVVTTYPGTGHALRVSGDAGMRIVAVLPHAFRTNAPTAPVDPFPEAFAPRIQVTSCHPRTVAPIDAMCSDCGSTWTAATEGEEGLDLPQWASTHRCVDKF
jgi:mannose-6-phosphate isomerase-like protein (cupin superfamily)